MLELALFFINVILFTYLLQLINIENLLRPYLFVIKFVAFFFILVGIFLIVYLLIGIWLAVLMPQLLKLKWFSKMAWLVPIIYGMPIEMKDFYDKSKIMLDIYIEANKTSVNALIGMPRPEKIEGVDNSLLQQAVSELKNISSNQSKQIVLEDAAKNLLTEGNLQRADIYDLNKKGFHYLGLTINSNFNHYVPLLDKSINYPGGLLNSLKRVATSSDIQNTTQVLAKELRNNTAINAAGFASSMTDSQKALISFNQSIKALKIDNNNIDATFAALKSKAELETRVLEQKMSAQQAEFDEKFLNAEKGLRDAKEMLDAKDTTIAKQQKVLEYRKWEQEMEKVPNTYPSQAPIENSDNSVPESALGWLLRSLTAIITRRPPTA